MVSYNYVLGNPISNIDPQGDTVRVSVGNDQFINYTPGMEYKGNNKFAQNVIGSLNTMNTSEAGATVLNELTASENNFSFVNVVSKDKNGNPVEGSSVFNAPNVRIGTLIKLKSVSKHLTFSQDAASGLSSPTILDQYSTTLSGRGVSSQSQIVSADAFRHIAFSAVMTFMYNSDVAKSIGDAHERDKTGLQTNQIDSMVDLINNEYGRVLGNELKNGEFNGMNLGNPQTLSSFLNQVAKNVSNAFPEIGSNVIFSANQQSVQNLANKIE